MAGRNTRAADRLAMDILAWRLANADFSFGMNPELTAHTLSISRPDAAKARLSKTYKARIAELKSELNRSIQGQISAESEKLRMGIATLVPRAVEVLSQALNDPDNQIRAAQEILDRDGRLPKVSRVQQETREQSVLPEVDKSILEEFHKPN